VTLEKIGGLKSHHCTGIGAAAGGAEGEEVESGMRKERRWARISEGSSSRQPSIFGFCSNVRDTTSDTSGKGPSVKMFSVFLTERSAQGDTRMLQGAKRWS